MPPSRLLAPLAVALVALGAVPQTSIAQSRDDDDRQARTEFVSGRDAFRAGNFADAASRFERAFALSQRPQLLYNIGTAYDRLHRWPEARDAFHRFLEALPEAAEVTEVRARLTIIELEIQHLAAIDGAAGSAGRSREPPSSVRIIIREVPSPSRPFLYGAITLSGLAIISGIVSVTVGILTNNVYAQLATSCGMSIDGCPDASITDIQLRAGLTNAFAGTAGALAVGAVAMFVADAFRSRRPAESLHAHLRLAPSVSPFATPMLAVVGVFQ